MRIKLQVTVIIELEDVKRVLSTLGLSHYDPQGVFDKLPIKEIELDLEEDYSLFQRGLDSIEYAIRDMNYDKE